MASPLKTPYLTLPLALAFVVLVAGIALRHMLAHKALSAVAEKAGGARYTVALGRVEISPFQRSIRIDGLRITPLPAAHTNGSATVTVHARTLDLSGVDLFALLWHDHLKVGLVRIDAPEVIHTHETRAKASHLPKRPPDPPKLPLGVEFLHVDTLRITHARGSTRDRSGVHPEASVHDLDILLMGILMAEGTEPGPLVRLDAGELLLRGADARMEPFYTAHIDSLRVRIPAGTARIHGLRIAPEVDPDSYAALKHAPMELYEVHADSLLLDGFDLSARLDDGSLTAKVFSICGLEVDIHRDRSVPYTEARPRSPLPAERVREWRVPVDLERVRIHDGRVTYHERSARGDGFGSVTLTRIDAELTGLGNMRPDSITDLHLVGQVRLWDRAPARLDLQQSHAPGGSGIEARVRMGELPAQELNHITDDLLEVRALAGKIHRIDLHMQGDDRTAHGTVHMHYEDLKLKLGPTRPHAALLNLLANAVVHGTNRPGDRNYRTGRVRVHRKQETSVFNYLWRTLREGMLDVLLPDLVLDRLQKHKAQAP